MFLVLIVAIVLALDQVTGQVVINTPNGKIQGLKKLSARNHTFYAFLQIPYAEPPLGNLRFRDPQPVQNWIGILNATAEKSICYQFLWDSDMESEDCLYLNVYTPKFAGRNARLPVMFYIHGGGFLEGDSSFLTVGPHYFMDHDVVIVTIYYRLGPFGFLSTEDSVLPGNYGLKDQNMALKWVQKNIQYFGGDPSKVTIFGQSSGAASVVYQMLSKKSQGLFRGVIALSGSALAPHAYQRRAKHFAYRLAGFIDEHFNASSTSVELLDFLQKASSTDIDTACKKFSQGPGSMTLSEGSWFAPVIESESEEAFITERMYESIRKGNANRVPLVIGMTSEETLSFGADLQKFKELVQQYDANVAYLTHGDMHITNESKKTEAGEEIRKIYTDGLLQDNLGAAITYFSDAYVGKPVMRNAELQSNYSDVYFYQFSYHGALGNNSVTVNGAGRVDHSEDLNYLWVSDDNTNIENLENKDRNTVERYLKLFTDFSKTLNPTPKRCDLLQNIKWMKVQPGNFRYLDIDENLEIKTNLKEKAYKGWNAVYEKWAVPPFDTY